MIFAGSLNLKAQDEKLKWVKTFGVTSNSISNFTLDNQNNFIVAIGFDDSIDADLGSGENWIYNPSPIFINSLLIAKYNSNFELIWAGTIEGNIPGQGMHLLCDKSNNIFLTLRLEDSLDADPSANKLKIYNNMIGNRTLDFAVIKLNSHGAFQFVKQFGSTVFDFLTDACLDKNGDIYLTGNFRGKMDFNPGTGTDIRTPSTPLDLFLIKLDNAGEYQWGIQYGGTGQPSGDGLNIDLNGNIILTGQYTSTSNFNPRGTSVNKTSKGGRDFFIARYTTDGTLINVLTGGGSGIDYSSQVICTKAYKLYVFGTFEGNATFDPNNASMNMTSNSSRDHFIAFYDTSGNCLYRTQKPIVSSEFIYYKTLLNTSKNETWFISDFKNKFDIDFSTDSFILNSKGKNDIFIQKMDVNNKLKTSGQIGSSGNDGILSTFLSDNNELYIMGYCFDSCLINYQGTEQLLIANSKSDQVFILKIADDNIISVNHSKDFKKIEIYPNPINSNFLYIKTENNTSFELVDLLGKKISAGELYYGENALNIENFSTGMYILKVNGMNNKVMIQK